MFTLQRLSVSWTAIVLVTGLSPLTSEPVSAGSYSYQQVRNYGGYRSYGYNLNRRRNARYNKFYRYRLRNYGKYYNHNPDYGKSYLGDSYYNTDEYDIKAEQYPKLDLCIDTENIADTCTALGWTQLSSGDYPEALETFSKLARYEPNDGSVWIGSALASAMNSDLHKGVWAMRSALRIEPDSLYYLTIDSELEGVLLDLVNQYRNDEQHTLATTAREFMLASLYYLLGDDESAGKILPVNDKDISTRNLRRLVMQVQLGL